MLERPNGILLVTGPTGSGKTTTLYTSLLRLNTPDRKILTVEDPIEYQLEGVNQVQVKSQIGLTFANVLRSMLRQDPDIIMIGEIRDLETAQIAAQAALTGHLVLSTLHTNSAAGSVTRLLDMGLEDYLLASTLNGISAQRLVRTLCAHCREPNPALGGHRRADGPRALRRRRADPSSTVRSAAPLQRHRLLRPHRHRRDAGDDRRDPQADPAPRGRGGDPARRRRRPACARSTRTACARWSAASPRSKRCCA